MKKTELRKLIQEVVEKVNLEEEFEGVKHAMDIAAIVAPILAVSAYPIASYIKSVGGKKALEIWNKIKGGNKDEIKKVALAIKDHILDNK